MIERKFISEKLKEQQIQEFIAFNIKGAGHSHTKVQRTPLGEKIIITASRPGLVVGRKGQNINQLTKTLKKKFSLENPQIEINEVENVNLESEIVAQRIADSLEKYGTSKFKGIGHKVMTDVMNSGALGIEIKMSGKIPGARAKTWRFYQGYLKKCGEPSLLGVKIAYASANLKTGVIGVKVSIMQPDVKMPDSVTYIEDSAESTLKQEKTETKPEAIASGETEKKEPDKDAANEQKPKRKYQRRKKKVDDSNDTNENTKEDIAIAGASGEKEG